MELVVLIINGINLCIYDALFCLITYLILLSDCSGRLTGYFCERGIQI